MGYGTLARLLGFTTVFTIVSSLNPTVLQQMAVFVAVLAIGLSHLLDGDK